MKKVEISHRTIIFTVFFIISLWFLYQIRGIILVLFLSLIFSSAFSPLVSKLEKYKIPRRLSIFLIYFLIIGTLILSVVSLVPVLISQTNSLLEQLPSFLNKIGFFKLDLHLSDYSQELISVPANVLKVILSTASNIIGLFAFLVINFYILMERSRLKQRLDFLFSGKTSKKAEKLVLKTEKELGGWVRAEIILMFIIGVASYLGLRLLDIDYALPLALIAGFLELVPNIGPTLSMVPAVIVGFADSSIMGIAVICLYFLIQQVENHFVVPKVMQKVVGLHPLVTILALMIGLKIGGVTGTLLAVPFVLFIKVIVEVLYISSKRS